MSYVDKTQLSVNYPIDVRKRLVNVDSRFREDFDTTISTSFTYRIPNTVKNVTSMRVASIEIPNTWYEIRERDNTSFFRLTYVSGSQPASFGTSYLVQIPDGNYSTTTLMAAVQAALNAVSQGLGVGPFVVQLNSVESGRIGIVVAQNETFKFDFDVYSQARTADWGLGYIMGFRKSSYTVTGLISGQVLIAESFANLAGPNYIFLDIDEYRCIENSTRVSGTSANLAKIIVSADKGAIVYDDGANLLTKEIVFPSPQNITSFVVKLKNAYGEILDLNQMEFSFTLEFTEIANSALYQEYRTHLVYNPSNS